MAGILRSPMRCKDSVETEIKNSPHDNLSLCNLCLRMLTHNKEKRNICERIENKNGEVMSGHKAP